MAVHSQLGRRDRMVFAVDSAWPALTWAFIALAVLFLIAPLIVVAFTSFNSFALKFPPEDWSLESYRNIPGRTYDAFLMSLRLGALSVLLAMAIALPAALGLVRGWLPGRRLFEAAFRSPLQVPAVVIGVSFYQYYVYLFDTYGIALRGSFFGLVLAHVLIISPYMLIVMVGRVGAIHASLEEAAYGLGAGFVRTTLQVTLPLMRPAIIAGAFLGFLVSFDDVAVALFLSGVGTTTLPLELLGTAEQSLSPVLYASATLTIVFSAAFALLVERTIGLRTALSA